MTALFENQRMSLKNLFDGIRLYILGAIYIFIIAAPLYFIYQKIIATFGAKIDIFLLITCPLLATAFLLFFLSGMQKIARGLALMLGIKIACDSKNPYHAYDPAHFFSACHLSLAAYLQDYLIKPITAATRSNKVLGKLLSTIAASAFLVAILSPRVITWQIWLTSLPILCLLALLPYRKKAWSRTLTAFACTLIAIYVLGLSFTFPILSTPAPLLTWRSPADTLSLIVTSAFSENIYYLSASILCLSPLVVIVAFRRLIIRHIRHGMRIFHQLEMLILLFLFSIILFYFMPRFPALSTGLLAGLLL